MNLEQSAQAMKGEALPTREVGTQGTGISSRDLTAAKIALVVHEANRAYCIGLGDYTQDRWENAPQWQRDSAIAGVRAVLDGSAKTPEEQHQAWCDHKVAEGWTHGPDKNAAIKTHPCLVPYDQLPEEQKRKDHLFRAIVLALTEAV